MAGYLFSRYMPSPGNNGFDDLFRLFRELLVYTAGDVAEALDWMNQLDREHGITGPQYGMGDFIEDLKAKGYIRDNEGEGVMQITSKTEQSIRKSALEEIFRKLKKSPSSGNHRTHFSGEGSEQSSDMREFRFGDNPDQINITET